MRGRFGFGLLATLVVVGCSSTDSASVATTRSTALDRRALRDVKWRHDAPALRPTVTTQPVSVAGKPTHRVEGLLPPLSAAAHKKGVFHLRHRGTAATFSKDGFGVELRGRNDATRHLSASFVGARAVAPVGEQPGTAVVHEYLGEDPAHWATSLPTFGRLAWEELYPGVDLVAEPSALGFSYRYVVSPGADPSSVVLAWSGARSVSATDQGQALDLVTDLGTLRVVGLRVFEVDGTVQRPLPARFLVDGTRVSVAVDGWDGRRPLVVDPSIGWATYLGGSVGETGDSGADVDGSGNVYVGGVSLSTDFPASGAYDSTANGGIDLVLTKISSAGVLQWATYLGSANNDLEGGVAVDSAGNAYLAGSNSTGGFPTLNAFRATFSGGGFDAVVAKLTTTGTLSWSSYLGGSGDDRGYHLALDPAGTSLYVVGHTLSSDFPTVGAYDASQNGNADIYVAKVAAAGGSTGLLWSTFVGGAGNDYANSVTADGSAVYVAGVTETGGFPTVNAFDTTFAAGGGDAVVFKMASGGGTGSLTWSTYLGGAGSDSANAIAVDGAGDVYVGGSTTSSDFALTSPFDSTLGGANEAFLVKIKGTATPATVAWSSYLGGSGFDYVDALRHDGTSLYVLGHTTSPDFPLVSAFDSTFAVAEATLLKVNPGGGVGAILWSSFLGGGSDADYSGKRFGLDSAGNLYIGGYTDSTDAFTKAAFDTTLGGVQDLYVLKVFALNQGDACLTTAGCPSGFCVDGVCCDTACTGACRACTATKKGSGANGVCGNVAVDTDPDSDCAASPGYPADCKADGLCDGAGACRVNAKAGVACAASCALPGGATTGACNGAGTCSTSTTTCGLYACGATTCKTTCTLDTDCVATAYCAGTACAAKKGEGVGCAATNECSAGTCVDCGAGKTCRASGCPDAGPGDTGPADTGATDTGVMDTGTADTGVLDTGTADTGVLDTGTADTGTADTGADGGDGGADAADTSTTDSSVSDTGTTTDTGTESDSGSAADTIPSDTASTGTDAASGSTLPDEACGCETPGRGQPFRGGLPIAGLLAVGSLLLRRRRGGNP